MKRRKRRAPMLVVATHPTKPSNIAVRWRVPIIWHHEPRYSRPSNDRERLGIRRFATLTGWLEPNHPRLGTALEPGATRLLRRGARGHSSGHCNNDSLRDRSRLDRNGA